MIDILVLIKWLRDYILIEILNLEPYFFGAGLFGAILYMFVSKDCWTDFMKKMSDSIKTDRENIVG